MSSTSNKTLNVTWDQHSQNLCGLFQDLYESQKLCDVTLYCSEGVAFKAHKAVLTASSSYFSKIFHEVDMNHPVIVLKGVTYKQMQQLLEFMYKGSINIIEQEFSSLIEAGSFLQIKGIEDKSNINLTNNDNKSNEYSRDSSPSGLRRETRFKGQKRVDVHFTLSTSTHSGKKRDLDDDKTEIDITNYEEKVTKKKKTNTQETNNTVDSEKISNQVLKKSNNLSEKSEKNKTVNNVELQQQQQQQQQQQSQQPPPPQQHILQNNISSDNHHDVEDGVSKLVIKNVFSTRACSSPSSKNSSTDPLTFNDFDKDLKDTLSDLEDESLVVPDVSFQEIDGEQVKVSPSDEDNEQNNADPNEHLNINFMECSFCNMAFKNDNDLFCHQKVHTEKKPYKCDFCDTFFLRSSHLARHRRKHIGDRPYECTMCDKAFSRSDKLRAHCRQAHDDDYKPPPHLKKKYEFIEYTGEKKGRGRPRKYPIKEKPVIDGPKRGRGRPRKSVSFSVGEPAENYDITNLPFGDFSMLTESLALSQEEQHDDATPYQDISIIPVASTSTSTSHVEPDVSIETSTPLSTSSKNDNNINTVPSTPSTSIQSSSSSSASSASSSSSSLNITEHTDGNINESQSNNTTEMTEEQQIQLPETTITIKKEIDKSDKKPAGESAKNELITTIRQIGECTIQPVQK